MALPHSHRSQSTGADGFIGADGLGGAGGWLGQLQTKGQKVQMALAGTWRLRHIYPQTAPMLPYGLTRVPMCRLRLETGAAS